MAFGSKKDKKKLKEFERQEKMAAVFGSLGQIGQGLGELGRRGGGEFGRLVSEQSASMAGAASEGKALVQEKLEKKAGTIGRIGRVLGAAAGTVIGGPVLGAAVGGAFGGTAGYKAAGGENSALQQAGGYAIQSAIPGVVGKVLPFGLPGLPGGAPGGATPGYDPAGNLIGSVDASPDAIVGQAGPVAPAVGGAAQPGAAQPGLLQRFGGALAQQMPRRRWLDPWNRGYGQSGFGNPNILSFGQGF